MDRRTIIVVLFVLGLFSPVGCSARIQKQPIKPADEIQAIRYTVKGDGLLREGKDHLALLAYLEASALNPYNEVIFNKLAIAYARLQEFRQAKRASDRSIRLEPGYPFAYNTRGIVYLGLAQAGNAVKSFKKAIRLAPDKPAFLINLGSAELKRGHFDEAREAYHHALELDPHAFDLEDTLEVEAVRADSRPNPERYYQMAIFFAELGDKENVLYYLSKALEDGFRDGQRLGTEAAFEAYRGDADFLSLVRSFGVELRLT